MGKVIKRIIYNKQRDENDFYLPHNFKEYADNLENSKIVLNQGTENHKEQTSIWHINNITLKHSRDRKSVV